MINAHGGRRSPAEVEILSVIEMQCPTAYAQSVPEWTGIGPPKVCSDRGSTRPRA
jgi:hypothetical protein